MNPLWVILLAVAVAIIWSGITVLDIRFERREIERYLRVGGARILSFRWKPLLGFRGADRRSKHYEVVFVEHTGTKKRAIFTWTAGIGVMSTQPMVVDASESHRRIR